MHRGALALLSSYGDDSSDDDVPQGRVSTKRCCADLDEKLVKKRLQEKLPLPQIINEQIQFAQDIPLDDPLKHNGKIRSFPHERGNWSTYVYIPYEPPDIAMTEVIMNIISSLPDLALQPVDDYHISLTKTVILKHHWIDSFVQAVREKVTLVRRFIIVFGSLKVYCNEERTRTFIALEIRSGYDTLVKLVEHLDNCLAEFRLPLFYKNPSFHMSLAWCVGDHEEEIKLVLPQLCSYIEEILTHFPQNSWYNYVTQIECKSGNKLFKFNLP